MWKAGHGNWYPQAAGNAWYSGYAGLSKGNDLDVLLHAAAHDKERIDGLIMWQYFGNERWATCSTDTSFKVAVEKIDDHALIKVMNEGGTIPQ